MDGRHERYGLVAIILHWLIAVLIIADLLIGLDFPHPLPGQKYSPKPLLPLHVTIGVLVLALTFARLGWRLIQPPPQHPPQMPRWERWAASATHWVFYLLMVGMPLSGWLVLSSHKSPKPITMIAGGKWPKLPFFHHLPEGQIQAIHDFWVLAHNVLAEKMLIAMLILHVGAVVKHHVMDKDPVLLRMIPVRAPRSGA